LQISGEKLKLLKIKFKEQKTEMAKIIGIDLGTTNSCVAVMEAGKPKVIPSAEGKNTIPSAVEPVKNLVGEVAKRQMILNPENTVYSIKRLMGRKVSEPEVDKTKKLVPYAIKAGKNEMAVVEIGGKTYTPQEISAMILRKTKADAESYLGEKVTEAVITVPAYFDDSQRQATKQAGEIAGLTVKRIINEPTAAALAYGLEKKAGETIAVYDLGGGTFDISILEIGDGVFEVKATNGDTYLGGDDFDEKIIDYLVAEFKKENGIDLRADKQALQRLRDAAERGKIELSSSQETEINLPFITQSQAGQPLHLTQKLTRAKLESLVEDLIENSFKPVEACLKDAKLEVKDIDEVILVGGQTRMPKIQAKIKEFFGKEAHKGVNPDEVVAIGAAIQGGVLAGDVKDVLLLDVTPLTLGLETLGSVSTPLIERNTTIPTSKSQVFSTAADSQTQVEINVLQGERSMAVDNKSLGRFILDGIPPAPRGTPQVEVAFDLDANGILKVSAKDKASGKSQSITIKDAVGLSKEEIEKAKKDAEIHSKEDEEKKQLIETKNQAEHLIFTTDKTIKEAKGKIKKEDKENLEKEKEALQKLIAVEKIDKEEIKKQTEKLSQLLQQVGAAIHQSGKKDQAGQAKPAGVSDSGNSDKPKGTSKKDSEAEEGEVVN